MILRITAAVLLVLLALAAVPALQHLREEPSPPPPPVRGTLQPPDAADPGSGDDVLDAAITPDGREIVFVATANGTPWLYRRALASDAVERVSGTAGASLPAWKRGGGVVSFFAEGRLRQVALADGTTRDLAAAPAPRGATWLPDGSLLFAAEARGPIRRLARGVATDATTLREGDVAHSYPEATGNASDFVYVAQLAGGRRIARLVRNGGQIDLSRTLGHAMLVGDRLVHVADGALTTQRFDAVSGALVGRAERLAFDVGVTDTGHAFFAASLRVIAWAAASTRPRELVWLDPQGQRLGRVAEPADYWQVRLSPDDRIAAVTMLDPLLRTLDVFATPAADDSGAPARRVSLSLSADSDPVWAPDGSRIAYRSLQGGQPNIFARPAQFSEQPDEVLLRSELDETPSDWRAGTLLFHAPGNGTGVDVWALNTATGERTAVARGAFNESDARWSPDGTWIAYVSDESGQPQIVVEPWPQDGRKLRATQAGGTRPRWRRFGRALYFLRGNMLMETGLAPRAGGDVFTPARAIALLAGARDIEPAHASDRLLAIVAGDRTRPPAAGLIVDW